MKTKKIIYIILAIVLIATIFFSVSYLNGSKPKFSEEDRYYSRYELPQKQGECMMNNDCVIVGCGNNLCVSVKNKSLADSCEMLRPENADCKCVKTECIWVNSLLN